MEQINAPYNFIPLSDQVVTPKWGCQVSHDLPFQEGLSGELVLDIHTKSPIMVGGEQSMGSDDAPGRVKFFKDRAGKYTIPGSSLRGVIRSVMEVATFSRMNRVDNKNYGLRDITGPNVREAYTEKVRNQIKTGFLELNEKGKPAITPCSMTRLSHRDLENWWNEQAPVFATRTTVQQKYKKWENLCKNNAISDSNAFLFECNDDEVNNIGNGSLTGFPVFTGQINAEDPKNNKFGTHYKGRPKYRDFVFYNPESDNSFTIDKADPHAWRDFLFIHGDEDGKPDMPWPGYWKTQFWKNNKVPVFYIKTPQRLQIGLAFMPKLAGDYSILDMIEHTSKKHLESNKMDFTSLVFGQTGEEPEDALKGRVYFEPATLQGDQQVEANPKPTILNGAKPSYFPNYIKQDVDDNGKLKGGKQYTTYIRSASNLKPELRGWKRYPVRPDSEVDVQGLGENSDNKKVQTQLESLPKGSHFQGRLVFHNLKPEELGALLWSIRMEGKRHSIGMGKSFGYGQATFDIQWNEEKIIPNNSKENVKPLDVYIQRFQDYMKDELEMDWEKTSQIKTLKALTSPDSRGLFKGDLEHMKLIMKPRHKATNGFVEAKKAGLALASYITETDGDCEWVDETITMLSKKNNEPNLDSVLRGKPLANEWNAIDDTDLKAQALQEIKRRWNKNDWWDNPPKGAARKAINIYKGQ